MSKWSLLIAFASLANAAAASAGVRLPKIFAKHAVLQRDQPIHFGSWATPEKPRIRSSEVDADAGNPVALLLLRRMAERL